MIGSVAYLSLHTCPLTVPGIGDAGGMNVSIHEQALAIARRGIAVDVYTRRADPDVPEITHVAPGYRVVHVDAGPPARIPIDEQVAHVGVFADRVLARAREQSYDLVHAHYWLSGATGLVLSRELGVPLANSFHTLGRVKDLTRRADESPSTGTRIATELEVIAGSSCVIAATPTEAKDLLDHYGADPTRLCVNPPGVDLDVFNPGDRDAARRRLGLDAGPLVLVAGRVQPLKGIDVALEAMARLPQGVEARLLVVGGPSGVGGSTELDRLRARAEQPDLAGRVAFRPAVPHHELADYLRAADVVHVPSRSESFGLVAVEAQACGTPVVAAGVGGLRHVVADGVSGLLVDGWEPADHAAALHRVVAEPGLADDLAANGPSQVRRFGWEATVDRLLELYDGITSVAA